MKILGDASNKFVKRAISISVIAAAVLFAVCSVMIIFSAEITQLTAIADARRGQYERAVERLNSLDSEDAEIQASGLYAIAQVMLSDGEYSKAQDIFSQLGEYKDCPDMKNECILRQAQDLITQEEYQTASELLTEIFFYSNAEQLYNECQYARAALELEQGEWFSAMQLFWRVKGYADAAEKAEDILYANTGSTDVEAALGINGSLSDEQLEQYLALAEERKSVLRGRLDVGFAHTIGLNSDGTVIACGSNEYGQCEVDSWNNVIQIAAGAYHTAALLDDGTVIACGSNEYGQCEVYNWKNVIQIAANDYNTFALLEDGTVVSCGYHSNSKLASWHDVDLLFADSYAVGCIYNDGYLSSSNESGNIGTGSFLVDAAVSAGYAIGLSADGSITANTDVPADWTQVIAVYASPSYAAAITYGGQASVYCFREQSAAEYSYEARVLSAALGATHYALLLEDGSVIAFGCDNDGQCGTANWNLN